MYFSNWSRTRHNFHQYEPVKNGMDDEMKHCVNTLDLKCKRMRCLVLDYMSLLSNDPLNGLDFGIENCNQTNGIGNESEKKMSNQTSRFWIMLTITIVPWASPERKVIEPHKNYNISIINMSAQTVQCVYLSHIRWCVNVFLFHRHLFAPVSFQINHRVFKRNKSPHINMSMSNRQLVLLAIHEFHSFESSLTIYSLTRFYFSFFF